MRDYLLIAIVLGLLPFCFLRPFIGIYVWYWIALMNPHRLTWDFAYTFPVAQLVAAATLAGFLVQRTRQPLPKERETILLAVLTLLFTINTVFATFPEAAWGEWQQVIKILLMTIMTVWLIDTQVKLRYLLFTITLSIGFFAVKATPWGIATGGKYLLWGPPESFVASNNSMGLALNMVMPLMLFLARNEASRPVRLVYYAMFWCSIFGVVLTYSRGSFLGLAAVLMMLLLRSRRKYLGLAGLVVVGLVAVSFVPTKWFERMETIQTYELDESVRSRLESWAFGWNLALERPLTGGGFQAFRANPSGFEAHSIYFGMLGDQGFVAFGLFLALILSSYLSLATIRRHARVMGPLEWYGDCAALLQVSLVAFLVNGLTLNHQYFDLFYALVATTIILKVLVRRELAAIAESEATEFPVSNRIKIWDEAPERSPAALR